MSCCEGLECKGFPVFRTCRKTKGSIFSQIIDITNKVLVIKFVSHRSITLAFSNRKNVLSKSLKQFRSICSNLTSLQFGYYNRCIY